MSKRAKRFLCEDKKLNYRPQNDIFINLKGLECSIYFILFILIYLLV